MRIELLVLGLIPVFLATVIYSNPANLVSGPLPSTDVFSYVGVACTYLNNQLIGCHRNAITPNGRDHVKYVIGQNSTTIKPGFQYLAIGNISNNQSTGNGLTQEYGDCGLSRQIGTFVDRGFGNLSISALWTSTCNARGINATSLLNNTTGVGGLNISFANANFSSGVTLNTDDQINVTYYWWVCQGTC